MVTLHVMPSDARIALLNEALTYTIRGWTVL